MDVLKRKWRTAVLIRSRFGWLALLRSTLLAIVQRLVEFRIARVYAMPLSPGADRSCQPGAVRFGFLAPADIDPRLPEGNGFPLSQLRAREAAGSRFFVGAERGRQCYFSMVSEGGFEIGGRYKIAFSSDREAYMGSAITTPESRGRGIYPQALGALAEALATEGKQWLYLYVETANDQSRRGVAKAGFRPIAVASVFGVGRFRLRRWHLLKEAMVRGHARQWSVHPLT
jgi:RimJ/RimL family protein N-acetyltransferase